MQILPTNTSPAAPTFEAAIAQSISQYVESFANTLSQAQQEFSDNLTEQTEDEKDEQENRPDVYAHSTNGYTYTLDEVCFSQQEIASLLGSLQQNGAPRASLGGLQKLSELPGGANLGQVLTSLKGGRTSPDISDEDANDITSFLGSIDPSGVLAGDVMDALYRNDALGALRMVRDALGAMDSTDVITLNRNELLAFGRGCGLGENALQNLSGIFNGAETATANAGGLDKLLSPVADKLLSEQKNAEELDAALNRTLGPMLQQARDRMQQEAAAGALRNRTADHSQVMIDQTVQQGTRQVLNSILDAAGDPDEQNRSVQPPEGPGAALREGTVQDFVQSQSFQGNEQHSSNGNSSNGSDSRSSSSWDTLLRSVQVQNVSHDARPDFSGQTTLLGQQFTQTSMLPDQPRPAGQNVPLQSYVADQVQNGLLQTLRNGSTRLDLQLHPQELGTIAVTLTAREGGVSAVIRAENAETVEMIQAQADQIRSSLEEQGIHVDSIEVERSEKNAENSDYQTWDTADQHNSFQEETARRDHLRRMRNLATIGNHRGNREDTGLERSMQRAGHQSVTSTRMLDRVA